MLLNFVMMIFPIFGFFFLSHTFSVAAAAVHFLRKSERNFHFPHISFTNTQTKFKVFHILVVCTRDTTSGRFDVITPKRRKETRNRARGWNRNEKNEDYHATLNNFPIFAMNFIEPIILAHYYKLWNSIRSHFIDTIPPSLLFSLR